MIQNFDIAVIGSGFAGSLIAMIAKQVGRSVILIDRGKHPRVVIGESSTPLANLLLEELSTRYNLPALRPLAKWGSWQSEYPSVACGLKRGFTFYHHDIHRPSTKPIERSRQLLVAASPNDAIADTHWYRADFDQLLASQAQAMGIEYLDETNLDSATPIGGGMRLAGTRKQRSVEISAVLVVDASGPRGFLHRALGLQEIDLPDFPQTEAVYSHFSGVDRLDRLNPSEEKLPHPIDDAAVHHVFEGGWMWVLHFNNGLTSAGVACTKNVAARFQLSEGAEAWQRVLQSIPPVQQQFAASKSERNFTHTSRLSFFSADVSRPNWALLPSAAGFVDPLLSTGFPLTLLGIEKLAATIDRDWTSDGTQLQLPGYAAATEAELKATAHLIAGLYANMHDFPVFSALTLLYFAAASFSETARRLHKPHLADGFLLHADPVFGPVLQRLLARSLLPRSSTDSASLIEDIHQSIQPFNVAGLADPRRNNWYPIDTADLLQSASKLQATREEIEVVLQRSGFSIGPLSV